MRKPKQIAYYQTQQNKPPQKEAKSVEKALMKCRIMTILLAVFRLFDAFVLFFIASYDIVKVILNTFDYFVSPNSGIYLHEDIIGQIIAR